MNDLNNRKKKNIILIVMIIIALSTLFFIIKENDSDNEEKVVCMEDSEKKEKEDELSNTNEEEVEKKQELVMVHVTGEVKKEGVYSLIKGSRIKDAVDMAGGITEKACIENINFAAKLEDEMRIKIPNKEEVENKKELEKDTCSEIKMKDESIKKSKKVKININKATKEELESISSVGPSTADKIIKHRNENGKFKNIEDIKKVKGIGESKFQNMKDEIEV